MFNNKRIKKLEDILLGEEYCGSRSSFNLISKIADTQTNNQRQLNDMQKQINKLKGLLNEVIDHVYKETEE